MSTGATRNGVIELDGHRIPFRLSGSSGRYGVLGRMLAFDRQEKGKAIRILQTVRPLGQPSPRARRTSFRWIRWARS